jgi:hypothetical protein
VIGARWAHRPGGEGRCAAFERLAHELADTAVIALIPSLPRRANVDPAIVAEGGLHRRYIWLWGSRAARGRCTARVTSGARTKATRPEPLEEPFPPDPRALRFRWRGLTPQWPRSLRLGAASGFNLEHCARRMQALRGRDSAPCGEIRAARRAAAESGGVRALELRRGDPRRALRRAARSGAGPSAPMWAGPSSATPACQRTHGGAIP